MDANIIKNDIVRQAFQAWQQADIELWQSLFAEDALLFDDRRPRDFMEFSTEAIGHERFTTIDKIEDNGTSIYGQFHSDTWGDFKTYFKFHIGRNNKIYQLDIGQANY